jgi:DNA repair exonuclease SbcCD ATPase subunit
MKKINFNKISVKNFLSFGEEPVVLEFKKGLHIITGINRDKSDRQNAIGKSALLESLYFSIFGTTIRELKKDLIANTYTSGACEVILDFDVVTEANKDSYKVVRTLNPSKLYLYKNGTDITRDSIKNTEEYLHTLINASPSIFQNCVIMTLNDNVPFMAKSKVDKRKFIEGIFNLDVFSRMLSTVRDNYTKAKRDYEIELTKMEDSERTLNSLNTQKDNILDNRKKKISVYEQRKVDNLSEKTRLTEEFDKQITEDIEQIKEKIKEFKSTKLKVEALINSLSEEKFKIKANINQNQTTLPKIGVKGEKCPTCIRPVKDHDKDLIKEEKEKISKLIQSEQDVVRELEEKIEKHKSNKEKIEVAIDKSNKKINQYAVNEQKRKNIKERIKQLDGWLSQLDGDIEELKSTTTEVDTIIVEHISSLETLKESVLSLRNNMSIMDTVKFIVSEEGVKSYIVKKILLLFNDRIRHYLSKLDANCICNFDEYFEEQIINEKNKLCSYFNFSGAERKSIDFSCMFSFMDMRRLQGDVTYNIAIYDELLDTCVDQRGMGLVLDIIKERIEKYDECVLVISHRKENIKEATGDVIYLEKKNNITKRINYNPFV